LAEDGLLPRERMWRTKLSTLTTHVLCVTVLNGLINDMKWSRSPENRS